MPDEQGRLTVGSLFSGIGGFDLGFERAGMRIVWFCEQDEFCARVLGKHWPGVPVYPDVRELQGGGVPTVDVLCGGFPCQDLSYAGRGEGIGGARSGLWSEFARLIGEIRPSYVVVENVAALLGRGMGVVLGDLAALGFDAEWDCIPASAVGGPHRRDRVWLVAYPNGDGGRDEQVGFAGGGCSSVAVTDGAASVADSTRVSEGGVQASSGTERERVGASGESGGAGTDSERERLEGSELFGVGQHVGARAEYAGWWAVEPSVGRVAHGIPHRVDRLRSLGNALVPQIAEWIGERIVSDYALRGRSVMVEFVVHGIPKTAGSKRAFVIPGKDGARPRAIVTDDSGQKGKDWRSDIQAVAVRAMDGRALFQGPLAVDLRFNLQRPKGHYGSGRNAEQLKPGSPYWHSSKPDIDKLSRAVLDALKGICWLDDSQVCDKRAVKVYTDLHVFPGVEIRIRPATPTAAQLGL